MRKGEEGLNNIIVNLLKNLGLKPNPVQGFGRTGSFP